VVWTGEPFARLVEFSTGAPTGALVYSLTDDAGTVVDSGSITINAGDVSNLIVIDGAHNTISGLFAGRTLAWHYTTATGLVTDRTTYRVDSVIPFPVSCDGSRDKLGVDNTELPDDLLDMLLAYSDISQLLDPTQAPAGSRTALLVTHAIEAQAVLRCLPILQVTLASRESSGTNSFQRYDTIDWNNLESYLYAYIARAQNEIAPTNDPTVGKFLFQAIPPAIDAVTGASN
jgi:hypothetical protein